MTSAEFVESLVSDVQALARRSARQARRPDLADDLAQEGLAALIGVDPAVGRPYALSIAKTAMRQHLYDDAPVTVPRTTLLRARDALWYMETLGMRLEDAASRAGLTPETLAAALDAMRARLHDPEEEAARMAEVPAPDTVSQRNPEAERLVWDVLDRMDKTLAQALVMAHGLRDGVARSGRELAAALGVSHATAARRLRAAEAAFREALDAPPRRGG